MSHASERTAAAVSPENWGDWRWHLRNRVRTVERLRDWIRVTAQEEEAIARVKGRYSWSITPYYASLMDPDDPRCPIRQQAIPSIAELISDQFADEDPVRDRSFRVTNRVIHKYPDRVVFLVTSLCPVLCRHCTRKHHTTAVGSTYFADGEAHAMDEDFEYLERTPAIRDVLLTGGDPLSYGDEKLQRILERLRAIPHIELIRIGTRYPVLLPQRITPELCRMLAGLHPVWVNTHFNHPKELTPEAEAACDRLLRYGVPVGNQSVLLKGINDDVATMRTLCHRLVQARVRPYYLYHCDNVEGVSHFRTTVEKGREIMRGLWGHTTGFAVPQYVVTTPAGKIPLGEDHIVAPGSEPGTYLLRSYTGELTLVDFRD